METGIHELTAAYALDALDPEERREYESHLARLRGVPGGARVALRSVTEALAVAASGPAPGPELRDRILSAARAEPPDRRPVRAPRQAGAPGRGRGRRSGGGRRARDRALGEPASRATSTMRGAALEQQRVAAAILADPNARTVALTNGQGRLVVDENGRAVLVLGDMGPAPAGKTYEVWVVEGESAVPPACSRARTAPTSWRSTARSARAMSSQ